MAKCIVIIHKIHFSCYKSKSKTHETSISPSFASPEWISQMFTRTASASINRMRRTYCIFCDGSLRDVSFRENDINFLRILLNTNGMSHVRFFVRLIRFSRKLKTGLGEKLDIKKKIKKRIHTQQLRIIRVDRRKALRRGAAGETPVSAPRPKLLISPCCF